ncbi:MAG: head decoration protein [Ghiorsea sp.]
MAVNLGITATPFINDALLASDDAITDTGIAAISQTLLRGQLLGMITATSELVAIAPAAADGSQNPYGILADNIDTTAAGSAGGVAAASACAVYVAGAFKASALTGYVAATHKGALRNLNIYIKTSV